MTKDEQIAKLKARVKFLEAELEKCKSAEAEEDSQEHHRITREQYNSFFPYKNKETNESLPYNLVTPFKETCDSEQLYELLKEFIDNNKEYCIKTLTGRMLKKGKGLPNEHEYFWMMEKMNGRRVRYYWKNEHQQWKLYKILKVLRPYLNGSVEKTAEFFFNVPRINASANAKSNPKEKKQFEEEFRKKVAESNILKVCK